jgi:hypothetical protein
MFIIVRRPLSLVEPTQLRLIAQGSVSVFTFRAAVPPPWVGRLLRNLRVCGLRCS